MSTREAAEHWMGLARAQVAMARHEEKLGLPHGSVDTYYTRARMYKRTAVAMLRELDSGTPCCGWCGGAHEQHEHSLPDSTGCTCCTYTCPWCLPSRALVDLR